MSQDAYRLKRQTARVIRSFSDVTESLTTALSRLAYNNCDALTTADAFSYPLHHAVQASGQKREKWSTLCFLHFLQ